MQKRNFSLLEVLTVVAIIAVLMALLIPHMVGGQGKKARAKADMKSLEIAVASYESAYNILPILNGDTSDTPLNSDDYDTLMQVLAKVDMTAGGTALNKKDLANDRSIQFLHVNTRFASDGYLDPWGKRYVVILDSNCDNKVAVGATTVQGKTAIYSFGPDGDDDQGKATGSSGNNKFDDVPSWE